MTNFVTGKPLKRFEILHGIHPSNSSTWETESGEFSSVLTQARSSRPAELHSNTLLKRVTEGDKEREMEGGR